MKATLKIKGSFVKIYIDDLLHLSFKQQDFAGIQSWKEGANWYDIEYYLGDTKILCAYDDFDKWKAILKLIDAHL